MPRSDDDIHLLHKQRNENRQHLYLFRPQLSMKSVSYTHLAISVNDKETKDFSKSEWCVIQQVGLGLSNKEIAAKLFLSEGTVRNYISKI